MKSLSRYLAELSELVGHENCVHFDRIEEGSAELKWWPEDAVDHSVRVRLEGVSDFLNIRDIHDPVLNLNRRLANDNASAVMIAPNNETIASFPGVRFTQFKEVPAFWQEDRLQGRLIRIGGKDSSIHAHIEMGGKVISNITLDETLARELVKYFLGPSVALNGKARWCRDYLGNWKLLSFQVHSFDVLDDRGLEESMDKVGGFIREGIENDSNPYSSDSTNAKGGEH